MSFEEKYLSKMIRVSAHDRNFEIKNTSNSDFEINVPNTTIALRNVHAVSVVSVQLPNMFYNVKDCKFTFTRVSDGQEFTINLDDGQYSVDEFFAEFGAKYNTALGGVTFLYNPTTSANPYLDENTQKINLHFGIQISFTASLENNCCELMGFSFDNTAYTTAANGQLTSPYIVNLAGVSSVFVHSKTLSNGSHDMEINPKNVHSIVAVPMDTYFGETTFWQNSSSSSHIIKFNSSRQISRIPLSLRNNRGKLLDINGADWSIVFKVYYTLN